MKKAASRAKRERMPAQGVERTVLITGATGSVGALLVEEALAHGFRVRASDRPGAQPLPAAPGLTWVWADLAQPESIPPLVDGIDSVVHSAAWVDIHVSFEVQAPINLDAVRLLYEAAERSGVRHFVFYSTGSLYAPSDRPLTEDSPLKAASGYERAKLLAEDYLSSRVGSGPIINSLRPALIYGPRGKVLINPMATVPVLLSFLDGYIPGMVGGPRTNLVHALDAARAALFLLEHPQPDGALFNVAADEVASLGVYMDLVLELAGMRRASFALPFPTRLIRGLTPLINHPELTDVVNGVLERIWSRLRLRYGLAYDGMKPRLDLEALPYLTRDTVFDNARLKSLGFTYSFPDFRSGWEDTLRWHRANRWLPPMPAAGQRAQAV